MSDPMNRPIVEKIADAVLYEGYLLYPYRPSVKNRQRWTFGGLYPRSYSEAQAGTDPWMSQTECLVHAGEEGRLSLRVRFLQLQLRRVEGASLPVGDLAPGVPSAWQEAVERDLEVGERVLAELVGRTEVHDFAFPARRTEEPMCARESGNRGTVIREQHPIAGSVELSAGLAAESLYKVTVRVRNDTALPEASACDRDEALLRALVSTHAILGVRDGEFVSMIDPPEPWREIAAGCRNLGTWPVLVGEPGARDTMLSSPIILYDYPQVAPESPGDLFDATEIDEILTLRILTLTEDEKRAMSDVDDRARALLERTESLAREQLMGLHGAIRGLRPV
jgi:hydrogenase maturation protease